MTETLLETVDLKKYFTVKSSFLEKARYLKAVDGVDVKVKRGETFGIVGESGCGKTTLGLLLLRLLEPTEGEIYFDGVNILKLKGEKLRDYRKRTGVVFQDPYSSLNPRMRVREILSRPLKIHGIRDRDEITNILSRIIVKVGLSIEHLERYPHQLSGGQQQRVAIARAVILNPQLVLLDEPTSSLDVSVQAQILNLLLDLQKEYELTYFYMTHDILTVKHISDHVAVMYMGKIVELSDAEGLFEKTLHPYTSSLLIAVPMPTVKARLLKEELKLKGIYVYGEPSNPIDLPSGCRFHPRCPFAIDICRQQEPTLMEKGSNHKVACHRVDEIDVSALTKELWSYK